MSKTLLSHEIVLSVNGFANHVNEATKHMFSKWNSDDFYLTPTQAAIYVLFFRNSTLWDSIFLLLTEERFHGAEFLFRMQLEGVITFEWCCLDIENRALMFRMTSFYSTLEYLNLSDPDNSYSIKKKENIINSIEWLKSQNNKPLPPRERMIEELSIIDKPTLYRWHKYFSKKIHGELEEWNDYQIPPYQINSENRPLYANRIYHLKSIASFLQMRNIITMSQLVKSLAYGRIDELEIEWARIYSSFEKEQNNK